MEKQLKYNEPWILQRADPYVYRHTDGTYYFTASVPEYDRIVLRSAAHLADLADAEEHEVWHKHESGPQSIHIWAEKVGVGRQISNLYIARMKNGYTLDSVQVLLTTPDYDWERHGFWVNEGPAVIQKDGKVFMTYSASDTGVHYCMGMMTADADADLLDPLSWKKERYPVLTSSEKAGIYGPGHNSFTKDEAGDDIMVYHARTETEIVGNPLYNPNRHAMLMKIRWQDGRPVFGFDE